MKLTIIREDGAVYKDGVSYSGLDLSAVPANVHALQFNDASNAGWIEFNDNPDGSKPKNEPITELPIWASIAITKWDEAQTAYQTAQQAAANQPITSGTQAA
jgi:hypothetical protein